MQINCYILLVNLIVVNEMFRSAKYSFGPEAGQRSFFKFQSNSVK